MSLPIPEPGRVLNYSYLWLDRHESGAEEGEKPRPALIINILPDGTDPNHMTAYVLPLTRNAPDRAEDGFELPAADRKLLGLEERTWVRVDQLNSFTWPGPDLMPRKAADRGTFLYDFGLIRPKTFKAIIVAARARRPVTIRRIA